MKLYFRATIYYDYTRVGYEDYSCDYSLTPFEKGIPARGYYEYFDYDLPDIFTEQELKELGRKIISSSKNPLFTINQAILEKQNPYLMENIKDFIAKYSMDIVYRFSNLRNIIHDLNFDSIKEKIFNGNIVYYIDNTNFLRIRLSKYYLEIEGKGVSLNKERLFGLEIINKNILRIYLSQEIESELLRKIFIDSLND